jgi:hypothetical protein
MGRCTDGQGLLRHDRWCDRLRRGCQPQTLPDDAEPEKPMHRSVNPGSGAPQPFPPPNLLRSERVRAAQTSEAS